MTRRAAPVNKETVRALLEENERLTVELEQYKAALAIVRAIVHSENEARLEAEEKVRRLEKELSREKAAREKAKTKATK